MDLQFFGGSGAGSGRRVRGGGSASLQPSPELDKIQPAAGYRDMVENLFKNKVEAFNKKHLKDTITEKDLKLIEDKMREMTNSNEVYVGIHVYPRMIEEILESGRFKSQFETGYTSGVAYLPIKANVEWAQMGYSESIDPAKRPIYGMLFEGKTPSDITPSKMNGTQYGSATVILKPDVKRYSTVVIGDSYDQRGSLYPSPLLNPSRYSIACGRTAAITRMNKLAKKGEMKPSKIENYSANLPYAEVQIHGGHATTRNIDRIIFARDTPKESIPVDKLKAHGIKWEIEK